MPRKVLLISVICGLVLLISCTGPKKTPEKKVVGPVSAMTDQVVRVTATQASLSISTPIRIPASPLPEPTSTLAPSLGILQSCLRIQPSPPEENKFQGTIVLESYTSQVINPVSFYDLNTKKITEFPDSIYGDLLFSPDRTMFAYRNWADDRLEIFFADHKRIKSLSTGKYWGGIYGWLDDQRMIIVSDEPESPGSNFVKYPRAVVIVNPFTNQVKTLVPEYPDIDQANSNSGWSHGATTTVYDPTLNRVVYPGYLENRVSPGFPQPGIIIYGIPEKKKLAFIPDVYWRNAEPIWSPDGSQFLMMGEAEFYLVSKDGIVSKISHMNPEFDPSIGEGRRIIPEYFDWSPDGQMVALWLERLGTDHITLAILDTQTGKITDTCIPAGYNPSDFRVLPYPVWSPDGRSLVVAANYRSDEDGNDVIVVNLGEQTAYKISVNLIPTGWLVLP